MSQRPALGVTAAAEITAAATATTAAAAITATTTATRTPAAATCTPGTSIAAARASERPDEANYHPDRQQGDQANTNPAADAHSSISLRFKPSNVGRRYIRRRGRALGGPSDYRCGSARGRPMFGGNVLPHR